MKKAFFALMIAGGLGATYVKAAPSHPTLNWGSHVNAASCDRSGPPVVNVTGKVVNDVDSGLAGNWAFDEFNRTIQVWRQADGTYCAVVRFSGQFDAQVGVPSPGNTGVLTGEEDGTFEGGYWAIINGTLLATPSWKTRGNIGTLNYQCDLGGTCPGYISWLGQYFSVGYTFGYQWWGWIYHGIQNSWVNSSDGNSGDVL